MLFFFRFSFHNVWDPYDTAGAVLDTGIESGTKIQFSILVDLTSSEGDND